MLGTKFYKPLADDDSAENSYKHYAEAADWCNANKAVIEDKGDYYEVVSIPEPTAEEKALDAAQVEYQQLLQSLSETDYVAAKLAEGVATKEDYAEVLAQRQTWRTRINELIALYPTLKNSQ